MKKLLIVTATFLLCPLPATAMELSLSRAVEMIIEESQDLKKAVSNIHKARAGLDAAKSGRWFKLDASASYSNNINVRNPGDALVIDLSGISGLPTGTPDYVEIPNNIGSAGLTLSQPIYTFGRIGNAVNAARHAVKMAEFGSEMARREILAAAAQIYWTAKMTDEMVDIARKNLISSQKAEERLLAAGRADRANLVKISADIEAKKIALSDAEFNRDSAHRSLKIMAGIDTDELLSLTDEFPKTFAQLTAADTLAANPEWDLLTQQARMHQAQADASSAQINPLLAASASYSYTRMHDSPRLWDARGDQSASVGMSFSIPLWDGGASRANAAADRQAANAVLQDLDKSRKNKTNDYKQALLNHRRLRDNLANLKTARDLASRTVQMSMDRFASGRASAVELSEVQAALTQMDMTILNTKFNILMAEALARKLGGDSE